MIPFLGYFLKKKPNYFHNDDILHSINLMLYNETEDLTAIMFLLLK